MNKNNQYKAYKSGFFKVTDGHNLYYELYGNPKGKPMLFLHGGPGAGFTDDDKKYFDPEAWNVILFDQRGAGRSKPFASLHKNTTQELIKDIRKLLDFLKIKKTYLFGGSWGATLGLTYAIERPEDVLGMILRGIFLARKVDNKHYIGAGVKNFFPEAWERLVSRVPLKERKSIEKYYLKQMLSDDEKIKEKFSFEWAYYEMSILKLKMSHLKILKFLKHFSYKSLSLLEAHYIANLCFIPENFILKNAHKIKHIPISIVHGRYDFICPPINAYQLHKKLKNSNLFIVTAGHSASEKNIEKKLISEVKSFSSLN